MALKEYDFEKEPTVSIVKKILADSIKMKATDIHFDPQPNELIIKFRINGNLEEYTKAPENVKANIITRIKILANMNITEALIPQIGAINFDIDGKSTNMRVSTLPVSDGEKIVIHISNYAKNIKSISKIGFTPEDISKIKKLIKEPQGIILVTGTASSGKTTTMYALLKELNNKSINIISIEDPIKMKIDGINQVQIAPEKGLTYKSILKNILLQDPNIVCISELVDDETTRSAIRTSVSGRLVLSTMHTKNAYTTVETLLNMDVENYLLGSNLLGIISQRLVKKLCPNCREKKKASDYEKKVIKYILNKDVEELYYPKGCSECQNGYVDQIPVIEVITIDDELRSAISNNKNHELIRSIIYANNNSILKDAFEKALSGETSFNEVIRITDVKIDFTKDEENIRNFILGNEKEILEPNTNEEIKKKTLEPNEEQIKKALSSLEEISKEEINTKDNIKEDNDDNKENNNSKEEKIKEKNQEENNEKTEEEKEDKNNKKEVKEETEDKNENTKDKEDIEDTPKDKTQDIEGTSKDKTEENEEPKIQIVITDEENNNTNENSILNDDDDEDDFNYNESYSIF